MAEKDVTGAINELRVAFATLSQEVRGLREDVVGRLQRDVTEIRRLQENSYVTQKEFDSKTEELEKEIKPLKKIVYGVVATVGFAVLGALLSLVLR